MWEGLAGAGVGAIAQGIGMKYQMDRGREESDRAFAASSNFARDMSNTAHQREVADLRAAGLNPILSGLGGGGASAPSSAQQPAHVPDFGAVGAGLVSNATQVMSAKNQLRQTDADLRVKDAQAGLLTAERVTNLMNQQLIPTAAKRGLLGLEIDRIRRDMDRAHLADFNKGQPGRDLQYKFDGSPVWQALKVGAGVGKGLFGALSGGLLGGALFKGAARAVKPVPKLLQHSRVNP